MIYFFCFLFKNEFIFIFKQKYVASNLSIVFGPSLLIPEGQAIHQMLMDAGATRLVMEYLIQFYPQIFLVFSKKINQFQKFLNFKKKKIK